MIFETKGISMEERLAAVCMLQSIQRQVDYCRDMLVRPMKLAALDSSAVPKELRSFEFKQRMARKYPRELETARFVKSYHPDRIETYTGEQGGCAAYPGDLEDFLGKDQPGQGNSAAQPNQ